VPSSRSAFPRTPSLKKRRSAYMRFIVPSSSCSHAFFALLQAPRLTSLAPFVSCLPRSALDYHMAKVSAPKNSDPAHHLAILLLVSVLPRVAQEAQTDQTEHNRSGSKEFRLLLSKILDVTRHLFRSG
jgi:hypothetical protein